MAYDVRSSVSQSTSASEIALKVYFIGQSLTLVMKA